MEEINIESNNELLTGEEQNAYFEKLASLRPFIDKDEKSYNEYIYYRNRICENNYRLVTYIVGFFKGYEFSELAKAGYEGLIDAVENFSLYKGIKFSTYATYHIKKKIIMFIRHFNRDFYIPQYMLEFKRRLNIAYYKFMSINGREPTNEELAKILNVNIELVEVAMALNNRKIIPEAECTRLIEENKDEDIDDLIIVKMMQEDVDLFLSNHLNETDELIIRMLFGIQNRHNPNPLFQEQHSLQEVASILNISYQGVNHRRERIFNRILKNPASEKLKEYL